MPKIFIAKPLTLVSVPLSGLFDLLSFVGNGGERMVQGRVKPDCPLADGWATKSLNTFQNITLQSSDFQLHFLLGQNKFEKQILFHQAN